MPPPHPSPARAPSLQATLQLETVVAQARTLARAGRLRAAEELLRGSLRSSPITAETLDVLARIYAQAGDAAAARTTWETALVLDASCREAQAGLRKLAELVGPDGHLPPPRWPGYILWGGLLFFGILIALQFTILWRPPTLAPGTPVPSVATPVPAIATPAPVVAAPTPVATTPMPVVATPMPVTATPVPVPVVVTPTPTPAPATPLATPTPPPAATPLPATPVPAPPELAPVLPPSVPQ